MNTEGCLNAGLFSRFEVPCVLGLWVPAWYRARSFEGGIKRVGLK